MAFPVANFAEYYIAPTVTAYTTGASAPPWKELMTLSQDDWASPAMVTFYGAAALAAGYAYYHSRAIPGKRGENQYKVYSLYPFFRKRAFFKNKNRRRY